MKKRELQNILTEHADQLITGRDQTEAFIRQHADQSPELAQLLRLAQRICTVLIPVSPRATFIQQLQQDLLQVDQQMAVAIPESDRRPTWIGAATLGSLLSLIGLLLFLRRQRIRPGLAEAPAG